MDMPYDPPTSITTMPKLDFSDLIGGLDPTPTLEASRNNILIGSTMTVRTKNAQLLDGYLNVTWKNYVTNMQSGEYIPQDRRVPPQPPMAWELAPADSNGYVFPMVGTKPVCNIPLLPTYAHDLSVNKEPNVMMIGHNIGGAWFQALPGDTWPNGKTTPPNATSTDGVTGIFQKFGEVAGYGWYELVKQVL